MRILVADAHAIVRRGLRNVIQARREWEICGEAEDGAQALEIARHERPRVAIVDVYQPKLNGLGLIGRLAQECPDTQVLVFSMHDAHAAVERCLDAGALGYVLKTDVERELTAAIASIGNHRRYLSPRASEILQEAVDLHQPRTKERFTRRECEIMELMSDGYTNKDMARAMGLSPKTIETHRTAAMSKASVCSATDLIRYAIKQGFIVTSEDASSANDGSDLDLPEMKRGVRGRQLTSSISALYTARARSAAKVETTAIGNQRER